jgi:hypothetical protein
MQRHFWLARRTKEPCLKSDRMQLVTRAAKQGSVLEDVRFEVFKAVTMKNSVFSDVTPCGSCNNRSFGGTYRLLHQGDRNRWTRRSVFGFTFQNVPISFRIWQKIAYSYSFLRLSRCEYYCSLCLASNTLYHFGLGQVIVLVETDIQLHMGYGDLHCLCCSLAIINTNVSHKVWEIWLCFCNMRKVSPQANQLKHKQSNFSPSFLTLPLQSRLYFSLPTQKVYLAIRMHTSLANGHVTAVTLGNEWSTDIRTSRTRKPTGYTSCCSPQNWGHSDRTAGSSNNYIVPRRVAGPCAQKEFVLRCQNCYGNSRRKKIFLGNFSNVGRVRFCSEEWRLPGCYAVWLL